jgi:four helix bundle protein
MSGLKNYRDLDAWKLSMTLVETTYTLTQSFPDSERYGLTAQMRRCSVSIPSNIAEGQARGLVRVGLHFIRLAIGSSAELSTQAELARRLKYVTASATCDLDSQLERVQQMLYGMLREHQRRLKALGATVVPLFLLLLQAACFLA